MIEEALRFEAEHDSDTSQQSKGSTIRGEGGSLKENVYKYTRNRQFLPIVIPKSQSSSLRLPQINIIPSSCMLLLSVILFPNTVWGTLTPIQFAGDNNVAWFILCGNFTIVDPKMTKESISTSSCGLRYSTSLRTLTPLMRSGLPCPQSCSSSVHLLGIFNNARTKESTFSTMRLWPCSTKEMPRTIPPTNLVLNTASWTL